MSVKEKQSRKNNERIKLQIKTINLSKKRAKNKIENQRGITLLVLVITIVVLLILAGITISAITGDNGIIKNAGKAKDDTEIANEKEIVEKATVQAMGNNKYGNIEESELQEQLDKIAQEGKTEVLPVGEEFEVVFIDSKRYYNVDKNGDISDFQNIIEDKSPGDITKNENGDNIEEGQPYEIWCVEDLVAFSNMVNGEGIIIQNGEPVEISTSTNFSNNTVVLKRNLNFKSKYSYANSERTDFGDINGNENDGNTLINEMTTGTGFNPIGYYDTVVGNTKSFNGIFDGDNNEIFNLYQSGLFGNITGNATIKNITLHGIEGKTNSFGIVECVRGSEVNILNCKNYLDVVKSGDTAAGIVGYSNAAKSLNLINCINYGNIEGGGYGIGGLLGNTNTSGIINIQNSCNFGKFTFRVRYILFWSRRTYWIKSIF